jgi:hypothetical protein
MVDLVGDAVECMHSCARNVIRQVEHMTKVKLHPGGGVIAIGSAWTRNPRLPRAISFPWETAPRLPPGVPVDLMSVVHNNGFDSIVQNQLGPLVPTLLEP